MRAYFSYYQLLQDRNMFVQNSQKDFSSFLCSTKQDQTCLRQLMNCLTNKREKAVPSTFDFFLSLFLPYFFLPSFMKENDLQARRRD